MAGTIALWNKQSYGAMELKRLYPKYYALGLTVAVAVHLLALIVYFISGSAKETILSKHDRNIRVIDLDNFEAPTLLPFIPNAGAQISSSVKNDGIPIPVDDDKVEPHVTIKSTEERRDVNPLGNITNSGDVLEIRNTAKTIEPPETPPGSDKFVPVEKMPELIVAPKPEYPVVAIKAGVVGKVYVKVLVGKDGKVLNAFILKSDSELLNQAALDVSTQSVFTPAIQNNHPVAVWIVLNYSFNLRNQ